MKPLNLREQQTVRIQVLPDETVKPEEAKNELEALYQRLIAQGLMEPRPERGTPPPDPVSEEDRRRLAEKLGRAPGKSASEMVIEDRGEW